MSAFALATEHGPITDVVAGVRMVRGTFRMGPGMWISRTMTIVDVEDGCCIVNSVRLAEASDASLRKRTPIKQVVKLADGHGLDDPFYVSDGAKFWATEHAKVGALKRDQLLGDACPVPGGRTILFPGTTEAALWIPHGGGTLITCDSVQNHEDTEGASLLARMMTPMLGFSGLVVAPPMWRRIRKFDDEATRRSVAPLRALSFENLVTGHGPAIIGSADKRVRAVLDAKGL